MVSRRAVPRDDGLFGDGCDDERGDRLHVLPEGAQVHLLTMDHHRPLLRNRYSLELKHIIGFATFVKEQVFVYICVRFNTSLVLIKTIFGVSSTMKSNETPSYSACHSNHRCLHMLQCNARVKTVSAYMLLGDETGPLHSDL